MSTDTPPEVAAAEAQAMSDLEHDRALALATDAALRLHHSIYTLTCIVWQQLTSIHRFDAVAYICRLCDRIA